MKHLTVVFLAIFLGIFGISLGSALAESTSSNYILYGGALTSGGEITDSTSYILKGTTATSGSFIGSDLSSTNFILNAGPQALGEEPIIQYSITNPTIALSPSILTKDSISTDSTIVTAGTNAPFGYILTATATVPFQNQTNHILTGVTDGSVTAGSEEFGIAVTGDDASFADDRAISETPTIIATSNIYGNNRSTTVTFKAAVSDATESGQYSGAVTFIVTGNF